MQGLDAAATNVSRVRRRGSVSPLEYLEGLMGASGSVRYSRTSSQTPVWVTAQVLAALAGKTLPVAPPPASASSATSRAPAHADGAGAHHAHHRGRPHASRPAAAAGAGEAARASATARALGTLAALMLSPLEGVRGRSGP